MTPDGDPQESMRATSGFWRQLASLETRIDRVRRRLTGRRDNRTAVLQPYFGFGTAETLHVRARVLTGAVLEVPHPVEAGPAGDEALAGDDEELDDLIATRWDVLRTMWSRFETDEVPGAAAVVDGADVRAVADEEGYLQIEVPGHAARVRPEDARWRDVALALPESREEGARAIAPVLVPGEDARFAIVSDIDDTIVETHATDKLKMIPLVLTRTAAQRTAFPGVSAFYKALERGGTDDGSASLNPVFYVSSSPWNLYDVLVEYMALQAIPLGPIFLRDYGLSEHGPVGEHHEAHKGRALATLFTTYPDLSFVLVGDSGQRDPQVYAQAARDFPGRVRAVYLRDVSLAHGAAAGPFVTALAEMGVPVKLAPDTAAIAGHAAEHGLISAEAARRIASDPACGASG